MRFFLIASFCWCCFFSRARWGSLLAKMIAGQSLPGVAAVENILWRGLGIDTREMSWRHYLLAILLLNVFGLVLLFLLLMLQGILPLNPQNLPGLSGIWRSIPRSVLSLTPTGNPMPVKAP